MKILNFKDFMKKYILKVDTLKESELQRVYFYPIYPRDSKIYSDKGFFKFRRWFSKRHSLDVFYNKR